MIDGRVRFRSLAGCPSVVTARESTAVAELRIAAETRTEFGKGAARRIRRDGRVPAVIYGHGQEPVHLSLPGHATMLALKNPNALLTIEVDGNEQLALPKAVQRHVIKGFLEHVDLLLVRRGEKVTVEIAVHVVGEAAPDTIVNQELTTLSVEAEATHIPEGVEVSIEGRQVGDNITAGDVALPEGSSLVTEPEYTVVTIQAAPTAEELEADLATEVEAAEGEAVEGEAAEGEAAEGGPESDAESGESSDS